MSSTVGSSDPQFEKPLGRYRRRPFFLGPPEVRQGPRGRALGLRPRARRIGAAVLFCAGAALAAAAAYLAAASGAIPASCSFPGTTLPRSCRP